MDVYPTRYTDAAGSEETVIENDGTTLRMTVRGVTFSGTDFDGLEPHEGPNPEQLSSFLLCHGDLYGCRLECRIPVTFEDRGRQTEGQLSVELTLGVPASNGGIDRDELRLRLSCDRGEFVSPGTSGWFEDEMLSIQSQLPEGTWMRTCINCLYSDYSPYGHGLFGWMMCFRNCKAEYLKVQSKADFWSVQNQYDRLVQETYLCPEFERRISGTGYRG